jgi:hypothetical protein
MTYLCSSITNARALSMCLRVVEFLNGRPFPRDTLRVSLNLVNRESSR